MRNRRKVTNNQNMPNERAPSMSMCIQQNKVIFVAFMVERQTAELPPFFYILNVPAKPAMV